jgi:thiol-disulfide isomerase/thioredoxin
MKDRKTEADGIVILALILLAIAGCSQGNTDNNLAQKKKIFEQTPDIQDHSELIPEDLDIEKEVGLRKGNLAPDFNVELNGEPISIRSFSNEGKPLLLYFMATWCPYCRNDYDALSEIYPHYEESVPIISIGMDLSEKQEKLDRYIEKYRSLISMPIVEGKESILRDYNIRYTTTKYAIGKDGTILYAGSGELNKEQWELLLGALKDS